MLKSRSSEKKLVKPQELSRTYFIKIYMTWYEFTELWMIFWLAYFSAKTSQSLAEMIIWNNIHSCLMNVKALTFSVFFQSIFSSVMSDQHAGTGFNSIVSLLLYWEFTMTLRFQHSCSNHWNLEMEAECLTKTLSYLKLNISRTKNGRN